MTLFVILLVLVATAFGLAWWASGGETTIDDGVEQLWSRISERTGGRRTAKR